MALLKTLSMLRSVILMEPLRPLPQKTIHSLSNLPNILAPKYSYNTHACIFNRARHYHFAKGTHPLNCPNDHNNNNNYNPQDAFLKLISDLSTSQGREGQTANRIMGGEVTDDPINEWLRLDKRVNTYPSVRRFIAIGKGGDDFVNAMVVAAESVLEQPIPHDQVNQKVSSGGKYVSVNIGPLKVVSSDQVQAVYNAMRRDARVKCFL